MITTHACSKDTHDNVVYENKQGMHKVRVLALRQLRFSSMPANLVRRFILKKTDNINQAAKQ